MSIRSVFTTVVLAITCLDVVVTATPCAPGPILSYASSTCEIGNVQFTFSQAGSWIEDRDWANNVATRNDVNVQVSPYIAGNNVGFTFSGIPSITATNNHTIELAAYLIFDVFDPEAILNTGSFASGVDISAEQTPPGGQWLAPSTFADVSAIAKAQNGTEQILANSEESTASLSGSIPQVTSSSGVTVTPCDWNCLSSVTFNVALDIRSTDWDLANNVYLPMDASATGSLGSATDYLTMSAPALPPEPVPEPSSILLLGTALLGSCMKLWSKSRR